MLLNDIKRKLEEIDPIVCYGIADNKLMQMAWNYIVFSRSKLVESQNKTAYSDYFDVAIIREHFIPEGIDEQVIEKMLEIKGVRLAGDGEYRYAQKPNTNIVVEMLTLHFVRARK